MTTGSKYSSGNEAWGLCQKCALRFLLKDLTFDGYYPGLRVCHECYDSRQPQEFLVDVTDPTALWKPSPEWGPENPQISGVAAMHIASLVWTECIPRGGSRVKAYMLYRSISSDGVNFTAPALIANLPVLYYVDLADLVENGNPKFDNEGIRAEVLSFVDELAPTVTFVRYQVFAMLDSKRLANSNILQFLLGNDGVDSLTIGGVITAGELGGVVPSFGGNAIESLTIAGLLMAGELDLAGICQFGFSQVVLQVSGDETTGSNAFTDDSLTAGVVTTTGAATSIATNQLFSLNTLNIGAAGAGLTVPIAPGSLLDLSTCANNSWTVEGFIRPAALTAAAQFLSMGNAPTNGLTISLDTAGKLTALLSILSGGQISADTGANVLAANAWTHFALVYNGNVLTMYVGGQPGSSVAGGALVAFNGLVKIGDGLGTTDHGQMAQVRVTYGVALYITAFAPPVQPFSATECGCDDEFADTLLLLHFDGTNGQTTTVDSSSAVHSVLLQNGGALDTAAPKFGSANFHYNGSGAAFNSAVCSTPFTLGSALDIFATSEWTIECWAKIPVGGSATILNYGGNEATADPADFLLQGTDHGDGTTTFSFQDANMFAVGGGGAAGISGTITTAAGQWHHIALVLDGGVSTMYIDGLSVGVPLTNVWTPAHYGNPNPLPTVCIGNLVRLVTNNPVSVDEFRVSGVARYLSNFNPPQISFGGVCDCDADFDDVVLLLHFDGANGQTTTADSSLLGNIVSLNASVATLSTSDPMFGPSSLDMVGSGSIGPPVSCWLPLTRGGPLDIFLEAEWTIECWFRLPGASPGFNATVFNYGGPQDGGSNTDFICQVSDNGDGTTFVGVLDTQTFLAGEVGGGAEITTAANLWHHVAFVGHEGTGKIYVDGQLILTNVNWNPAHYTGNNNSNPPGVCFGQAVRSVTNVAVFIDEARVSRIARYTANFTPAGPFGEACA